MFCALFNQLTTFLSVDKNSDCTHLYGVQSVALFTSQFEKLDSLQTRLVSLVAPSHHPSFCCLQWGESGVLAMRNFKGEMVVESG